MKNQALLKVHLEAPGELIQERKGTAIRSWTPELLNKEFMTLSASIRILRFLNSSIPALCPKNQKCMKNIMDGEQGDSLEKSTILTKRRS